MVDENTDQDQDCDYEADYEFFFLESWRCFFTTSCIFYIVFSEFRHFVVKKQIPVLTLFFKFDWFHLFSMCVDIVAYDEPGKTYRFTVMYYLQSLLFNCRLCLFTQVGVLDALESLFMVFRSTN